ncbi:MAG: cyclic pyranopterin monophosphate synthase MoaC [Nitrospirota bacterium]
MKKLTHFDNNGAARMVDVSGKDETAREAIAGGRVTMTPATLKLIADRKVAKGDVLGVARVAGIMAAKRTPELIPLSHPLNLSSVEIAFEPDRKASCVNILATVRTTGRTGVEMEALVAAATAGLTIYDMCKSADRAMTVTDIRLLKKSGGKSGTYVRGAVKGAASKGRKK